MPHSPVYRRAAEGRTIAIVGDVYRFLATGAETDGKYCTWEATVVPGSGPPPHIHRREDESFYILEGEMTFYVGDDKIIAKAGEFAQIPAGVLHRFKNESQTTTRMIISVVPAGLEGMFFEVGTPVNPGDSPVPPSEAEIQRLLAAAPKYGIEFYLPGK